MLGGSQTAGKSMDEVISKTICQPLESTSSVRPKRIPGDGWTEMRVNLTRCNPRRSLTNHLSTVTYQEARAAARRLAELEAILCGVSSGAILHAATIAAQEIGRGKRVLAVLPDTGERYLPTELFS
jgi:cysteine synthase